jgi:hypothetical protein
MELAIPNLAVLSTPALQNCLKNMGKKPAMTVVAKAEFAQSYMAHPNIAFLLSFCIVKEIIPDKQVIRCQLVYLMKKSIVRGYLLCHGTPVTQSCYSVNLIYVIKQNA